MSVSPMPGGALPAPDPDVPCCQASANGYGCSCWQAVLRPEPHDEPQEGPQPIRGQMCGDCAYRPDSPERVAADGDFLPARLDQPFYCHDGMPRAVGYTHPELPGVTIRADAFESMTGDYQPLIENRRPYKADGSPATICAGWAAWSRARHRSIEPPTR